MGGFIPENILDEILDKCDIAEVISSYIPLKRAGRNYKALCPFHHEKTPSFIVNPEKGIFHCFGCNAGGNAFSFIMKYERIEFPEAVKMLAKKTGVVLPERGPRGPAGAPSVTDDIYRAHEAAASYFGGVLASPAGGRAREYLAKRGIKDETVKEFRLGLAAASWDGLLARLRSAGFKAELIAKTGLVIPRSDRSGHYDRFRNRLIFPIFNHRGRIIAFAGRVLDDSTPKYMNSPETQIYNKGRTLFGLNFSKREIGDKDAAVIVEGYTDLMALSQNGIRNVIASCGTALTQDQIRLLRRYTRNVIMVYDSDQAGEMATLRGLDLLLAEDMRVGIVRLPAGLDPDDFIRRHGAEGFNELLARPAGLLEYKLDLLRSVHGSKGAEAKTSIAGEMLRTIAKVNNAVLKSEYLKRLAESLDVDEEGLRIELAKFKKERTPEYASAGLLRAGDNAAPPEAEKILISLMMEDNGFIISVRQKLAPREFGSEFTRSIVESIYKINDESRPVDCSALMNRLNIDGLDNFLSEMAVANSVLTDKRKNLEDCVLWIKRENLKRDLSELRGRIKSAQLARDNGRLKDLVTRYGTLVKQLSGAPGHLTQGPGQ